MNIQLNEMSKLKKMLCFLLVTPFLFGISSVNADELIIAVASNFKSAMTEIAREFEAKTNHKVTLVYGSTGKHYAQIKNGAPFDAFFSADQIRPELLDNEGLIIPGSRFTYAYGKLVLWSPNTNTVDNEGRVLSNGDFRYIAMANPKLAPYGKAAYEVLEKQGLWDVLKTKVVRGENIGQTFQFVKSGNAELGLIAYSQLKQKSHPITGTYWNVPQSHYSAITQQAVQLTQSKAVSEFMESVKSIQSRNIIHKYGYGTVN